MTDYRLRVGRRVGRTLYEYTTDDFDGTLIGVTDTIELSREVADAVNTMRALRAAGVDLSLADQHEPQLSNQRGPDAEQLARALQAAGLRATFTPPSDQ